MLQVKNVSFAYEPNVFVLQNISFTTSKCMVNICGARGQGVTTLLKCISGLLPCTSMQCIVNDKHLEKLTAKDKKISLLLRRLEFFEHKTVAFNLQYQLKIQNISQSLDVCLQNIPIDVRNLLNRKVIKLTCKEKFKVALVRALLKKPSILIVDDADGFFELLGNIKELESVFNYIRLYGGKVVLGSHTPLLWLKGQSDLFYLENGELSKYSREKYVLKNIKTLHQFTVFYGGKYTSIDLSYQNKCWYNMQQKLACFLPNDSKEEYKQDVVVFIDSACSLHNITFFELQTMIKQEKAFLFLKLTGERIFL